MRLIDADELKIPGEELIAKMAIALAPTVDAVEVVRCRDCKYYEIYQLKKDGTEDRRHRPSYCAILSYKTRPDWFCADGERVGGEEDE